MQTLCLQVKFLELGGIREVLARALDPPEASAVSRALEVSDLRCG